MNAQEQRTGARTGMNRRRVVTGMVAGVAFAATSRPGTAATPAYELVASVDRPRILRAAAQYLPLAPQTITAFPSTRSPGGVHDYFSEADYFWPNPADPDGPYVRRDGQSNPATFQGHRKAMVALSLQVPALVAAWRLTGERRYGEQAAAHLRAWFVDPATRMNPNLEYAQGIHAVTSGRPFGIIDTLHLVEVARAISLIDGTFLTPAERAGVQGWFRDYLKWLLTSEKGIAEGATRNNHAVCWALQVAEFARLVNDEAARELVRTRFKTVFVPHQIAADGSLPEELARTKPYSYSIFNLDVMATLCQSLKTPSDDLFRFALADGRGIGRAADFLFPFIADKGRWPYARDVEHFDALPVRAPSLFFCGLGCDRPAFLTVWKGLDPDPTDAEIIRNYPIRQPLLWL